MRGFSNRDDRVVGKEEIYSTTKNCWLWGLVSMIWEESNIFHLIAFLDLLPPPPLPILHLLLIDLSLELHPKNDPEIHLLKEIDKVFGQFFERVREK